MRLPLQVFFALLFIRSLACSELNQHKPVDDSYLLPNGCASVSPIPSARAFYVDPVHGDMKNDGSSGAPWRSLEEVVRGGLIATQEYSTPYQRGGELVPRNPRGIVHGADVIYLRSGDHGSVNLLGAVNSAFITVEAEKGQTPILRHLTLAGASKWIFRGLTFQNTKEKLVELLNHETLGPTDNIILEGNHLGSSEVGEWSQKDWVDKGADTGIFDEATCSTLRGNDLRNLRRGIVLAGDNALVVGNSIDNFGDDAIDIMASRITIKGNRITNSHDLGDGNHNDAIQGWTLDGKTNQDTIIDGNTIIASTDPALGFPGYLQGISVFDGVWENIQITNNVVITNAWHGISLFGARNGMVINNTVMGIDRAVTTWIGIFSMKREAGGSPPSGIIVRNNIASKYSINTSGTAADHNIIAVDPSALFRSFDVKHARYDLHILANSRARGAGNPELAPPVDIEGRQRALPLDVGAYTYTKVVR